MSEERIMFGDSITVQFETRKECPKIGSLFDQYEYPKGLQNVFQGVGVVTARRIIIAGKSKRFGVDITACNGYFFSDEVELDSPEPKPFRPDMKLDELITYFTEISEDVKDRYWDFSKKGGEVHDGLYDVAHGMVLFADKTVEYLKLGKLLRELYMVSGYHWGHHDIHTPAEAYWCTFCSAFCREEETELQKTHYKRKGTEYWRVNRVCVTCSNIIVWGDKIYREGEEPDE